MTRKKFLVTAAVISLTAIGATRTFEEFTRLTRPKDVDQKPKGFGSSKYGV